jgi:hypothetical protein
MNNTNEQNAGNSNKPSFQTQNSGPAKAAPVATPPAATPDVKPEAKPEVKPAISPVIPEVVHQVTTKPTESKPLLQKQS